MIRTGGSDMGDIVKKKGKDGRFLGWYIRYVDTAGVRRQRASHQPTRALARAMLAEIEADISRARARGVRSAVGAPFTVGELCERFLCDFRSPKINDLNAYRENARTTLKRLLPLLADVRLAQLTRRTLERVRDELSTRYCPNSVRAALRPLGTALSWAVRQEWLGASPLRGLELPRAERSVERLTNEEAFTLLQTAAEAASKTRTPIKRLAARSRHVAIALALRMGLRRGEVFGLRWQDVDLDASRVQISRSYRGATKSGKTRHLPLPSVLVELLRGWRTECPSTRDGIVCPVYAGGTGWKLGSRSHDAGLYQLAKAAGIRRFARGWHCLRHSFSSSFVQHGGSLVALQKILGHSSPEITMIYAHLAPDYLAQEMERVHFDPPKARAQPR
jgi:integrase